jgi:hypothetical protein
VYIPCGVFGNNKWYAGIFAYWDDEEKERRIVLSFFFGAISILFEISRHEWNKLASC